MSLDSTLDALRRFSRKAVAKTKEIYTEARKAAGLPAGGPVTESNPRYYMVAADQGAMVREGAEMESKQLQGLSKGEVVTVVEILGRRGRICDPLEGWISLESSNGDKIFRQTVPLDKKRQVEAMERRFDRMKQLKEEGKISSEAKSPSSPMSGEFARDSGPAVQAVNPGTGAVVNLKKRVTVREGESKGSDLLFDNDSPKGVPLPRLAAPPGGSAGNASERIGSWGLDL